MAAGRERRGQQTGSSTCAAGAQPPPVGDQGDYQSGRARWPAGGAGAGQDADGVEQVQEFGVLEPAPPPDGSSRSMATCTAGPPKAIVPSLPITASTSAEWARWPPWGRRGRVGVGVGMVSDRRGCWRLLRRGRCPACCPRTAAES
jgi:hypothetical protein